MRHIAGWLTLAHQLVFTLHLFPGRWHLVWAFFPLPAWNINTKSPSVEWLICHC